MVEEDEPAICGFDFQLVRGYEYFLESQHSLTAYFRYYELDPYCLWDCGMWCDAYGYSGSQAPCGRYPDGTPIACSPGVFFQVWVLQTLRQLVEKESLFQCDDHLLECHGHSNLGFERRSYMRRMISIHVVKVVAGLVALAGLCHPADISSLVIPKFKVSDATLEESIKILHSWGIPICLEKGALHDEIRFSLEMNHVSVRAVLDALVTEGKGYAWQEYSSVSFPPPTYTAALFNIYPIAAKEDPDDLMNLRVASVELHDVDPKMAISKIHKLIPELAKEYLARTPRTGATFASEFNSVVPPPNEVRISLRLSDVTVRQVLNEIALRSGGLLWIYDPYRLPAGHNWLEFR
jgi:hypothetical protein